MSYFGENPPPSTVTNNNLGKYYNTVKKTQHYDRLPALDNI